MSAREVIILPPNTNFPSSLPSPQIDSTTLALADSTVPLTCSAIGLVQAEAMDWYYNGVSTYSGGKPFTFVGLLGDYRICAFPLVHNIVCRNSQQCIYTSLN